MQARAAKKNLRMLILFNFAIFCLSKNTFLAAQDDASRIGELVFAETSAQRTATPAYALSQLRALHAESGMSLSMQVSLTVLSTKKVVELARVPLVSCSFRP